MAEIETAHRALIVSGTGKTWIDVKRDIYRSHPHCLAVIVVRRDRLAIDLDLIHRNVAGRSNE